MDFDLRIQRKLRWVPLRTVCRLKYLFKGKRKYNQTIVSTVMSNLAFENYLKNELKIKLKRTEVGDINVISKMKKIKSILGGEQSGHIILSEYSNTNFLSALTCLINVSKLPSYIDFPLFRTNTLSHISWISFV